MRPSTVLLKYLLSFSLLLISCPSGAATGIQRTINSSPGLFEAYLKQTESQPFAQAYVQLSQKMEFSSKYIEVCLENIYLGKSAEEECLLALKELTQRPLNPTGREILFSFLAKIEKQSSSKQDFFRSLKLGLLETDPALAVNQHQATKKKNSQTSKVFATLETKAWKKALEKVIQIEESQLLINGKSIGNIKNWNPPLGVYQWSLVTNTHEPLIRLGTFLQFAADSVKNLKPFAENCRSLTDLEIKKFGLLQVEVFASAKCIAKETSVKSPEAQHLTQLPNTRPLSLGKIHWIWPTLALVGAGIAVGTRGKNVQVKWPAFK